MATNLHIDEELLSEAKRLGGHQTKRETVDAALREFVERRKRREVIELFGAIDFANDYDHKRERRRR